MSLKPILLIFALTFAPFAVAADQRLELAQKYVKMPEVQNMMAELFSPEALGAQVAATLPPTIQATPTQISQIGMVMSGEMQSLRPKMNEIMVVRSAEFFSVEELEALIDFYGSEHGAAIMTKMTPFMAAAMGDLAGDMQKMQQSLTPQLVKILQSK